MLALPPASGMFSIRVGELLIMQTYGNKAFLDKFFAQPKGEPITRTGMIILDPTRPPIFKPFYCS